MLFSKYFYLIKKHNKKRISNQNLFTLLLDSVINYIDCENVNTFFEKNVVSEILNSKRGIPYNIVEHIYDDNVRKNMPNYFAKEIVPLLYNEHSNLVDELIDLLSKYPNITKKHLSQFKSIAKKENVSVLLSAIFCYSILESKDNNSLINKKTASKHKENIPNLSIRAISKNNELSSKYTSYSLIDILGLSKKSFAKNIRTNYKNVSNIHLATKNFQNKYIGKENPFYEKAEFSKETMDEIKEIADHFKISISDDFFDLGGLVYDKISTISTLGGGVVLHGSDEEKEKYNLIVEIKDTIDEYLSLTPFINTFKNTKLISLAVYNSGNAYDEDITITLFFEKGTLLTIDEISNMDDDSFDNIINNYDINDFFGIKSGLEYRNYDSSTKTLKPRICENINSYEINSVLTGSHNYINKYEILSNYFVYNTISDNTFDVVKLSFDSIMKHDAVAFPAFVLLKKVPNCIKYTINSKYTSKKIDKKIYLKKDSK